MEKDEKIKDTDRFILTESAIMMQALKDFGINVNIHVAKAIEERFIELMIRHGHIGKEE